MGGRGEADASCERVRGPITVVHVLVLPSADHARAGNGAAAGNEAPGTGVARPRSPKLRPTADRRRGAAPASPRRVLAPAHGADSGRGDRVAAPLDRPAGARGDAVRGPGPC